MCTEKIVSVRINHNKDWHACNETKYRRNNNGNSRKIDVCRQETYYQWNNIYKWPGTDSLDLAELHMELEVAFDLEISNEDAEKMLTLGDAVECIKEHIQKNE